MEITGFGSFVEKPHVYYKFSLQRETQKDYGIETNYGIVVEEYIALLIEVDLRPSLAAFSDFQSQNFTGYCGFDKIQTGPALIEDADNNEIRFRVQSLQQLTFEISDYSSDSLFAWLRRISQGWLPYHSFWKVEWKFTEFLR